MKLEKHGNERRKLLAGLRKKENVTGNTKERVITSFKRIRGDDTNFVDGDYVSCSDC